MVGKIKMKFRLKEVRLLKGFSQNKLARSCELSLNTITAYENGSKKQYSHEIIEKFCEVLECTPADLFVLVPDQDIAA